MSIFSKKNLDSMWGLIKHHRLIKKDINTQSFIDEVERNSNLWSDERAEKIRVQRETIFISLRSAVAKGKTDTAHVQRSKPTKQYVHFPHTTTWLLNFARERNSYLSRAMIVNLPSRSKVYPHLDFGLYYAFRDRYHFVLKSKGSTMMNGGQEAVYRTGEVWWYGNKIVHKSFNDSDEDRIHVIFDMLPRSPVRILWNTLFWIYSNLRWNRLFIHRRRIY